MLVLAQRTSLAAIGVVIISLPLMGSSCDSTQMDCDENVDCVTYDDCLFGGVCTNDGCEFEERADGTSCGSRGTCQNGECLEGSGGSGGAAVPCSAPLPSSDAFNVDGYAVFDTRPGGISFATDGTLFVGNVGGPDPQQQTVPVLQVNPMAKEILTSTNDVRDPDVVIVDTDGSVATAAGHVFAGGENMQGIGQLTELSPAPFEIVDGADILGSCIDNVTVMLFDQSQRLLIGNFDQSMVSAAVCAVQSQTDVSALIETLPGDLPDAISGIVQEPSASGNLFVSQADRVHRFDSGGKIVLADYTTGTALGYGPSGSAFEGLLILRGNVLFRRSNLADDENDEVLLTFTDATGTANYVAFRGADLYISQIEQKRILRVSEDDLATTELGCGN